VQNYTGNFVDYINNEVKYSNIEALSKLILLREYVTDVCEGTKMFPYNRFNDKFSPVNSILYENNKTVCT